VLNSYGSKEKNGEEKAEDKEKEVAIILLETRPYLCGRVFSFCMLANDLDEQNPRVIEREDHQEHDAREDGVESLSR
jgi:hypothetical protein